MLFENLSSYPGELASELIKKWNASGFDCEKLPSIGSLVSILDNMYQASLLQEEGEHVRCRVILGDPQFFRSKVNGELEGVDVLTFQNACDFTPHNLRKLSAAAGYFRSLLGIQIVNETTISIWGMVVTGPAWVNRIEGGRAVGVPLPDNLVVHVLGPGHLVVANGYTRVLECAGGQLLAEGFDPFHSKWLGKKFAPIRLQLLEVLREQSPNHYKAKLCDTFIKQVAQSIVRRVLSLVRTRGRGGMLIYLPDDPNFETENWLRFRVQFELDDATNSFHRLVISIMKRVLEIAELNQLAMVTWEDYQGMHDAELSRLDAALIEFSHFLADLMSVDGALVLSRSFRIIGFGGEIMGDSHVQCIERALDLEAERTVIERADSSGTRHRSAYRLVSGLPDTIAIIVSQDGSVHFVALHQNKLTYWPYLP